MEHRREVVIELSQAEQGSLCRICEIAQVSRSCVYYKKKNAEVKRPGRPPPGYTVNRDGTIIPDQTIVQILKEYRSSIEFVNGGGSKKLSKYIAIEKHIYINHKKIYRICRENELLLFRSESQGKRKKKKNRCEYFEVNGPNRLWQFDVKYGYIHGESRYFFVLAFIDVFTKKVTGFFIGTSCKSGDLIFTLNEALKKEGIGPDHVLVIRSDNGPQMSSNRFFFYLRRLEQKLAHEFIPPRTPNRNAFIEAFFSILEIELLQVRYFKTFGEAYEAVVRFIEFYNNRRLHGSIGNLSPKMFIDGLENGSITPCSFSA